MITARCFRLMLMATVLAIAAPTFFVHGSSEAVSRPQRVDRASTGCSSSSECELLGDFTEVFQGKALHLRLMVRPVKDVRSIKVRVRTFGGAAIRKFKKATLHGNYWGVEFPSLAPGKYVAVGRLASDSGGVRYVRRVFYISHRSA